MSLSLDSEETVPRNLQVKTFGHGLDGNKVHLGTYQIDLEDFLTTALYVLTNTDLVPGDPRLRFVDIVRTMQEVPGWEPGQRRLQARS